MLGILGTGLIGASIGLRARELGWTVLGCDARGANAQAAMARGAIDWIMLEDDLIAQADVLVIAVPPRATVEVLGRLAQQPPTRAELVLDVASVKQPVVEAGAGVKNFVASHPMAGRERSGPEAADATLFDERPWAYVSSGDAALDERLTTFVTSLGGKPFAIEAELHDRTVALTSHLPQLVAFAFVDRLLDVPDHVREGLTGPVAGELRRIGASDRALWSEIFALNRDDLAGQARALAATLNAAADALDQGDSVP